MAHRLSTASSAVDDLIKKSISLSKGPPARYRLKTTRTNLDKGGKIRKWTFGQKCPDTQNKAVLLVGETGTGKTTLINTMVNYFLGVKFEDKIWFEITEEENETGQTESKTSEVTVYEIFSEEKPFSLSIIDTPGYGSTRGIDKDLEIARNLHKLFLHDSGVKYLDAVCLVLKASQNRISDMQHYIFEGVLSLFGKDIEDIIVLCITHSDGGPPTNPLEAIKTAKIPCCHDEENEPVHFLFNNRQSEKYSRKYENIFRSSWQMGEESLESFFVFLNPEKRKSLNMTMKVLQDRIQLEATVQSLRERIKFIEEKQHELYITQEILKDNKENIEKDENSSFTITVVYKEKVDITNETFWSRKATVCDHCEENCHEYNCWFALTAKWCYVMKSDHCTVCKCHYTKHVREAKKYITKQKQEEVTFKDLKQRYLNTKETIDKRKFENLKTDHEEQLQLKVEMEKLLDILKMELADKKEARNSAVREAYLTIIKLSENALKPDSAFTIQHLEFLIPRVEEVDSQWAKKLMYMEEEAKANKSTHAAVRFFTYMMKNVNLKKF